MVRTLREMEALIARFEFGDLLDRPIGARDEAGQGMDDDEVRDQLVTLYVAGHDTTAVAMTWTWTWWLLSQHAEIEARLHAELDASLDTPPAYAKQVVEEAMRLFPPAPRMTLRPAGPIRMVPEPR